MREKRPWAIGVLLSLLAVNGWLVHRHGAYAQSAGGDQTGDHLFHAGKLPGARRAFPSTWSTTRVFADCVELRDSLQSAAQIRFVATHFVGTQKLLVPLIKKLRAVNPNFIVLDYHLGAWQSGKHVPYILDGFHWGNDYNYVNRHESWFLHTTYADRHNPRDRLMASDGKLLMNVTNPHYVRYLIKSLIRQVRAGHDDGVFLDSWSTDAVNYYVGRYPQWRYPGLIRPHKQLGGLTWVQASEAFMRHVTAALNKAGIYVLPNLGDLITDWDHTNYAIPNGGMLEGAPGVWSQYGQAQWIFSANKALTLINDGKIIMFQSYLPKETDDQARLYWLGTYLLLRGHYTYITYFAHLPMEYFPEFGIHVGTPLKTARHSINDLRQGSLYIRPFTRGIVVVNSAAHKTAPYHVPPGYSKAIVRGGGNIGLNGKVDGRVLYVPVSGSVLLKPESALILVKRNRPSYSHR